MNSHLDSDSDTRGRAFRKEVAQQFMDELEGRAEKIKSMEKSKITGGADGESIIAEWQHFGVGVRQLPPDPQGILRVSIGGGKNLPVSINYCVFRGERGACIDLLRKALKALETDPTDS
jgi:hypothetical protein